ncbi:MAG TPA: PilZ domain-containing protein [Armatimonadaceae bacterium]|nr:PilZ domain-containing protein [Armatimonadaceae bacterium]
MESEDHGTDEVPLSALEALERQESALALLEDLRTREPLPRFRPARGGGRRDLRRWPLPEGVTIELHDGRAWRWVRCHNVAVGGACLYLPAWAKEGPVPARLSAPNMDGVLVLTDVMWRDAAVGTAGVQFEFRDEEEREVWTGALIDALLAAQALK